MSCKTCLRYGHTVKRCHETVATCARCSCRGHNKDKCTSTWVRCCHCGEDHQAFSRNCSIFRREMEIVQIRTKECITRLQAIQKLLRLKPNPEYIFSSAVNNTSNRTTSKSPTRTEQENQSESSEKNSSTVSSYGHGYYTQGKNKKKRSPLYSLLTVGGVRVKKPIK